MKKIQLYILAIGLLGVGGCSSDDGEDVFQATEQDLTDFFSEEVVQALNDLDFNINEGANPPNLEGTFFASPTILTASNVPSDVIGSRFIDLRLVFTNQDDGENVIDFNGVSLSGTQTIETFSGDGSSFISGTDNRFSVFSVILADNVSTGAEVNLAYAISGRITENGILDFEIAILMLDDMGDPFSQFIENGQGRRFVDEDGLAEIVTSSSSLTKSSVATGLTLLSK